MKPAWLIRMGFVGGLFAAAMELLVAGASLQVLSCAIAWFSGACFGKGYGILEERGEL